MCALNQIEPLGRPIRVVVFTGGPTLEQGVKLFIDRLEDHPEVELMGVFCQSAGRGLGAVWRDLARRRGALAAPLLVLHLLGRLGRRLLHPLAERALDRRLDGLGGRLRFAPDIQAAEMLAEVERLAPDLGLIYGGPILEPEAFEIPRLGTLGIHHGKLPDYRGKKTTFWAMLNGEPIAGVTIQRVNRRLDGGEIVVEGEVPTRRRSLGSVWRELEALGLELYLRAVLEVREGTATFRPQSGQRRRLYRDPKPGHLLLFGWRQLKRRLLGR